METPLHESPSPGAPLIALLAEGTIVSIDGPPVDGFYPVTAGVVSGWMRGETLLVEKDTSEPEAVEDMDATPLVDVADELALGEAPDTLEPDIDPAMSTIDPASDPAADTSAATDESPSPAEVAPEEEVMPVVEPVAADQPAPVNELAAGDEPASQDPAAVAPGAEFDNAGTPVPVTPDGQSPPPESAASGSDVAAEPTPDPNVTPIPVPEISPVGAASVAVDAPIRTGPGSGFSLIVTVPMGSIVQQTGHVIDGYVTAQYEDVTGWIALEHLGAPSSSVEETTPSETAAPAETQPVEPLPIEAPPVEALPGEQPPAAIPPAETTNPVAALPEATPS